MKDKPKIMLHYVKMGATGGPNIAFERIEKSKVLREKFNFVPLNQKRTAGGKINIKLILELKKEIEKERPDIIHISGMQSAGFHCMIAAFLAGCKARLITTHGFNGDDLEISMIKRIMFNHIIEPLTLILATKVQGISKFTTENRMVKRFASNKSTYIYNLHPKLVEVKKGNNLRRKLEIGEDEIVFTIVSRIVLDKGYKVLSEAIKLLDDNKNIRFIIVGDGKYEETFRKIMHQQIADKKVIMLGMRNDVMDILSESDVFVLPTLHENLGNVFLEASTVKIPSIGTNVGGVPEIIINGETGILIPPNDENALANAIKTLCYNPDLIRHLGENAFQRLNEFFNNDNIEKSFEKLYLSMLTNLNR